MKYWVTRASESGYEENPPCENTFLIKKRQGWGDYDDEYEYFYGVEINTLEEMTDFINKYGKIVLFKTQENEINYPRLQIYDTYRE